MNIGSLCSSGTRTENSTLKNSELQNMPRILFLASTKSQGGIERHAVELAAELRALGVPVQFACPSGSFIQDWSAERKIPTVTFSVRNSGDLSAVFRLAKIIHKEHIEIVHAHSRRDYVIAILGVALARNISRRPIRLILHAHMIRPLGGTSLLSSRFFASGADAVIAVSGAVAEHLRAMHDFSQEFVHLIPNGVDVKAYARPGSAEYVFRRSQTRRGWRIPSAALVLGMVGRLDTKGQADLLSAAPALLREYPSVYFVFIGSEGEAGTSANLVQLATAGGFEDHLLLTGPRDDIPSLLPALDILVHLPDDEAFGLAPAEAMASGLPTVATKIGGCREVVQDGVTGLLVPPGDLSALSAAISALLDSESGPSLRAEMGQRGRIYVEANFSQDRQIERLLSLYREITTTALS
jgi:glycosyltransferase involved in cell wall biosynthesis